MVDHARVAELRAQFNKGPWRKIITNLLLVLSGMLLALAGLQVNDMVNNSPLPHADTPAPALQARVHGFGGANTAATEDSSRHRDPLRVDLVIAHMDQPVAWIPRVASRLREEHIQARVFLYDKGRGLARPPPGVQTIKLPKVGREAHTYLHHMQSSYLSKASNVTVFVHASLITGGLTPWQLVSTLIYQAMKHGLSTNVGNKAPSPKLEARYSYSMRVDRNNEPQAPAGGSLGQWYDRVCAPSVNTPFPKSESVSFYYGASFAVHSSIRLPGALVEMCTAELSSHASPEAAHFLDKLWFFLLLAARNASGGERWRSDKLNPLSLDQRRSFSASHPRSYWNWEGCVHVSNAAAWEKALRTSQREGSDYLCSSLAVVQNGTESWRWDRGALGPITQSE